MRFLSDLIQTRDVQRVSQGFFFRSNLLYVYVERALAHLFHRARDGLNEPRTNASNKPGFRGQMHTGMVQIA